LARDRTLDKRLGMLKKKGENADNDMKQCANYITDSNDYFGVIKIIDKIINGAF
jgi:hypothetical protein